MPPDTSDEAAAQETLAETLVHLGSFEHLGEETLMAIVRLLDTDLVHSRAWQEPLPGVVDVSGMLDQFRLAAVEQPRQKRSVTLDAPVAYAVDELVERGVAESFSAAINAAAARWAANQQLRVALDQLYSEDPDIRPDEDAVEAAARKLGLA